MGEYATRISDNVRVKIGTCEQMFYIRYDDRYLVQHIDGNIDTSTETGLFWRLPYPDEDNIRIGEYQNHHRSFPLYKTIKSDCGRPDYTEDFAPKDLTENPGIIQLKHACGMLVNVPCNHGYGLPNDTAGLKFFWNGKASSFIELDSVKNTADGKLRPCGRCVFCNSVWSFDWPDVLPYVHDKEMLKRLEKYAAI